MTLRARLAVAFTAILLAPMAVGVAALAGVTTSVAAPVGAHGSSPRSSRPAARCGRRSPPDAGRSP